MNVECGMRIAEFGITSERRHRAHESFRPAFRHSHSGIRIRRRQAALTLIEILIAMFIFLIGIVGILAVFPVAMNSAGRAIGETRSNVLAQSVLAQLSADCRVNYEPGLTGGYASISSSSDNTHFARAAASASAKVGYFVTLVSGTGKGQSRLIAGDDGAIVAVAPPWTAVGTAGGTDWTQPILGDQYVITRMGLPEPPAIPAATGGSAYGTFGLNRDLVVRAFVPPNGFYAGIANWAADPATHPGPMADAFISDAGTAGNGLTDTSVLKDSGKSWPVDEIGSATGGSTTTLIRPAAGTFGSASTTGYSLALTSGFGAGQCRQITGIATTTLTVSPAWTPVGGWTGPGAGDGYTISHQFNGYLVRLVSNTGAGQARTVIGNSATQLFISPAWAVIPGPTTSYEVGWTNSPTWNSGYLLITSGKATGRILPITGDAVDNANGHLIVCAGADFTTYGVTQAFRKTTLGVQYNLQDGTTFSVIGNQQPLQAAPSPTVPMLLNALPWSRTDLPMVNTLNVIGGMTLLRTNTPYRLAPDEYGDVVDGHGTLNQQVVASDYSYAAIFSDNGTDPTLPVRVDVFVFRNFDASKDFGQNQKPVGHVAGYIKRP